MDGGHGRGGGEGEGRGLVDNWWREGRPGGVTSANWMEAEDENKGKDTRDGDGRHGWKWYGVL